MTDHYYSQKPTVKTDEKNLKVYFFGKEFNFITDSGVFSKQKIDFGTSLLIESFVGSKNAKILDMGCGYGPIGIIISSMMDLGEVTLADINERAINLTKKNIVHNKNLISDNVKLTVIQSEGFARINEKNYNYILLNPPIRAGKVLVFQLYEEACHYLRENGELWIVIQKKQGASSSLKKLETIFNKVEIIKRDKGYLILKNTK